MGEVIINDLISSLLFSCEGVSVCRLNLDDVDVGVDGRDGREIVDSRRDRGRADRQAAADDLGDVVIVVGGGS